MKIFSSDQIKRIEQLSMASEGISSSQLMERAAAVFVDWFEKKYPTINSILIVCGRGNNGGDGLVIARKLSQKFYAVRIAILPWDRSSSPDFELQLNKLPHHQGLWVDYPEQAEQLHPQDKNTLVIDAILGTGTNRPVSQPLKAFFEKINSWNNTVVSVDIPSGMYADQPTDGICIEAQDCLSFEFPKLAFFLPENEKRLRNWEFRSIGLSNQAIDSEESVYHFLTKTEVASLLIKRPRFAHKHLMGHTIIYAGSQRMCGAGILSATAALRSGVGLVSLITNESCFTAVHSHTPEIMCAGPQQMDLFFPDKVQSMGLGPGLLEDTDLMSWLEKFPNIPLVIDAEAIRIFSNQEDISWNRPSESIIFTPHMGELKTLLHSKPSSYYESLLAAKLWVQERNQNLILKGAYAAYIHPSGNVYFNGTGNSGMATAGTGDVLTGILCSLLAQGYPMQHAAIVSMWIHGAAGDLALQRESLESLNASDIIEFLGAAFKNLQLVN